VLLCALLVVAGCGDGPKIVKVSGVATYKGEPVPNLRLNFQPENGRPSWGDTDKEGRFTLEYDAKNKGALVGKHTVSATYRASTPDEEMGMTKPNAAAKAVEGKYRDMINSPLKIEITRATSSLEVKFE